MVQCTVERARCGIELPFIKRPGYWSLSVGVGPSDVIAADADLQVAGGQQVSVAVPFRNLGSTSLGSGARLELRGGGASPGNFTLGQSATLAITGAYTLSRVCIASARSRSLFRIPHACAHSHNKVSWW